MTVSLCYQYQMTKACRRGNDMAQDEMAWTQCRDVGLPDGGSNAAIHSTYPAHSYQTQKGNDGRSNYRGVQLSKPRTICTIVGHKLTPLDLLPTRVPRMLLGTLLWHETVPGRALFPFGRVMKIDCSSQGDRLLHLLKCCIAGRDESGRERPTKLSQLPHLEQKLVMTDHGGNYCFRSLLLPTHHDVTPTKRRKPSSVHHSMADRHPQLGVKGRLRSSLTQKRR